MRRLPQLLATGLTALAVAGCSGGSAVNQGVAKSFGIQGGNGIVIDLASHHYKVGDVSGTTLEGEPLSLASLRGKVVVVNFWGSWCAPCISEAAGFAQVAKDYASKGVAFVGIDIRDSVAQGRTFERVHHVPYPSIFDSSETLALQFPHAVPASTPTTIVVGRDGDILAKVTGPLRYTQIQSLVQHALTLEAA
ncbi:MAG TPA: TlpA disulfide reductase family protein [Mycobacteriales bacterium]|jgi:thiol-disulfide isomerase/thioredoxin|nr:TlpA disulfide reductase family protein [Mycobacteriales bacterium]